MDCKYCPEVPAAYFCENCEIGFCLNCVPEDKRTISPRCTLCRKHLVSFNTKKLFPSFWKQWSYFFRLPLSPSIFITLVSFAVFGLLLPEQGLGSLVIGGVYWGLLIMMLFELSNLLAEGRTDIPGLQEIWEKAEPFLLIRLLVQLIFVSVLIVSVGNSVGQWASISLLILYGLGFPASVLILSLEKKFFSAVNPLKIIYVITAIGLPYLWLYCTWLLATLVSYGLFNWQHESHFLYTIVAQLISFYCWTVWFVMLGYATYQYHEQLGIAVFNHHKHNRHQKMRNKSVKVKSAAVKEAEILITEQRFADAMNLLHTAMAEPMAEMDVHRYYLRLMADQQEHKRLASVSKRLVRQFIHQENYTEAAHIGVIVMAVLPDWCPELDSDAFNLAKGLIKMGKVESSLALLNSLIAKDIPPELKAKVYFEAAKLLTERFNRDKDAINYFNSIINDFSEQPIAIDASKYIEIIKTSLCEEELFQLEGSSENALIIDENR